MSDNTCCDSAALGICHPSPLQRMIFTRLKDSLSFPRNREPRWNSFSTAKAIVLLKHLASPPDHRIRGNLVLGLTERYDAFGDMTVLGLTESHSLR